MDANSNNTKRKYESAMPIIDEGWWQSVLAEERQHTPSRPPTRTGQTKGPAPVQAGSRTPGRCSTTGLGYVEGTLFE